MTGGTVEKKPINADYRLHCVILETVMCPRFLGVDISSNISSGSHMDSITGTDNKILGLVKRNIKTKMPGVMHLSIFPPEGERRDTLWELDDFEKSMSNSSPIDKNLVSKIPWVGHQICYII